MELCGGLGNAWDGKLAGEGADFSADGRKVGGVLIEMIFAASFDAEIEDAFHPAGDDFHFGEAETAGGHGGSAEPHAGGAEGAALVGGEGVGVQGEPDFVEGGFVGFAVDTEAIFDVDEDEVVVGATTLEGEAEGLEFGGEGFGVGDDLLGVGLEGGLEIFAEGHGFGGDDVFEGAALSAWENGAVDQCGEIFESVGDFVKWVADLAAGNDEAAAGTTEGFVGGGGHDVEAEVERIGVDAARNQAGDVGHVGHEHAIGDFGGNFGDAGEIGDFHEGGVTDEDDFGLMFAGEALELVVINVAFGGNAVADEAVDFGAAGDGGAVGEVAASGERHSEDGVTWLAPSKIDGFVGVGAGMGLDVGVVGVEELLGAFDGEGLDLVDVFVAAVVAFAWVAFAVFVGEDGAHGFQNLGGDVVFAGDEFEAVALADFFLVDECEHGVGWVGWCAGWGVGCCVGWRVSWHVSWHEYLLLVLL